MWPVLKLRARQVAGGLVSDMMQFLIAMCFFTRVFVTVIGLGGRAEVRPCWAFELPKKTCHQYSGRVRVRWIIPAFRPHRIHDKACRQEARWTPAGFWCKHQQRVLVLFLWNAVSVSDRALFLSQIAVDVKTAPWNCYLICCFLSKGFFFFRVLAQFPCVQSIFIHSWPNARDNKPPTNLCVGEKGQTFLKSRRFSLNMCIATSLISRSVSEMIMNNTFTRQGLCVCVCAEDFLSGFLQVSRLYHGTETPTSQLTTRTSPPAQQIPSTRPRTANLESARTERSRPVDGAAFSSDFF